MGNARWVGLVFVAVLAWNAAFVAAPRWGIFATVGVAALLASARSFAFPWPWRELFALRRDPLIAGLVAAGALVGGTALLRDPLLRAWPDLDAQVRALYDLFGEASVVQAYLLLPLTCLGEELVYRGAIQSGFEPRLGRFGAAFAAAVLYACAHLASANPTLIALALGLGFFWGLLRAGFKSLWPGLLSHVLWDLFVVVWAPLQAGPQYKIFRL